MQLSFKKLFLKTIGLIIPSDFFAKRFPVSIKGIFFIDNKVVLLKNERGEWDLPGGKLMRNETFIDCLKREVKEELSIHIEVNELIDTLNINVANKIDVIVLVYSCKSNAKTSDLKLSGENFDLGFFSYDHLPKQSISKEYLQLIENSFKQHA